MKPPHCGRAQWPQGGAAPGVGPAAAFQSAGPRRPSRLRRRSRPAAGGRWGKDRGAAPRESVIIATMTSAHAIAFADAADLRALPLPPLGETATGRAWRLRDVDARAALAIAQEHDLDFAVARVLAARGVTAAGAEAYLNPSLREALPDPYVLTDMQRATTRIAAAVMNGEGIGVFGDYDVDGTTASAMLHLYFRALGIAAPVYLPDRVLEGYGPSREAFLALKEKGAGLVVTVDCGAAAHAAIEEAAREGIDVVVIDHHQMSGPPPAGAAAVVNPNRADDVSGLENLSAAGVAFMLTVAVNRALREAGRFAAGREPNLVRYLDLAALGLVCDVMEMRGLARVLVSQGLKILARKTNPGLAALGALAGVRAKPSAYDLGFLLGPRINAAGRIGHARLAFDLLTTEDVARRESLAEKLNALNAERQEIEAAVQASAVEQIERRGLAKEPVIVVAGEGWHPGVVGVVAGRLKEKYDRPAVVIGILDGVGKGSGRSIAGVDLGAAVAAARTDGVLAAGGGHAMAAGLTVAPERIEEFSVRLRERLGGAVSAALADRKTWIDGVLGASAVSATLAKRIDAAGPFGPGNPEPVFVVCDVAVEGARIVGKGHVACTLKSLSGEPVRAIAFRAEGDRLGDVLLSGRRLHVAGRIKADDWRGAGAGQLHLVDAAFAP